MVRKKGKLTLGPHMWQYYRWRYHFKLLDPLLAEHLVLDTKAGHIRYFEDKKRVVEFFDFANGIRDRAQHNGVIPVGNYILIDKTFLDQFLNTKQMQLGYVIKQKHLIRDYPTLKEKKEEIYYELIRSNLT